MGSVRFSTCAMMEEFAQATTEAIRLRDEVARDHLAHVSRLLASSDSTILEFVDAYYVEVLMFGLDEVSTKWGWERIPDNLKQRYVAFWGHAPAE